MSSGNFVHTWCHELPDSHSAAATAGAQAVRMHGVLGPIDIGNHWNDPGIQIDTGT